jgi:hypothetical protein
MRGVYMIRNTVTGDRYIGCAQHMETRWKGHKRQLAIGMHHNHKLQEAWATYGADAFAFTVLEEVAPPRSFYLSEDRYLRELSPEYNLAPPGHESKEAIKPYKRRVAPGQEQTTHEFVFGTQCCEQPVRVTQRVHPGLGSVVEVDLWDDTSASANIRWKFLKEFVLHGIETPLSPRVTDGEMCVYHAEE